MKHLHALQCCSAALLFCATALPPVSAQHHGSTVQAGLGEVHFEVSCTEAAQREFDLAMAYYYSFAWSLIDEPLDRTLAADPGCGMAHWARALALLDNPFVWPANVPPTRLAEGPALLESARRAGLATDRERLYVEALGAFFRDAAQTPHRERALALERALETVAARHPEDTNAAILHALVLSANFDPRDKAYTNQMRAAAILEPIFEMQPQHPGVAHFLIHSYDYPPIAHMGTDAARRYGKIAPASPHALHMPSHIFTRVGAWQESIESNRASAAADRAQGWNSMHAYDYMTYAHLQLAQDDEARAVLAEARAIAEPTDNFAAAYAYSAMPARLALERGDWSQAAALELVPARDGYPWDKYPHAEAVNAFARGLGAAVLGDGAAVQVELERLSQLRDRAVELKLAYWVEQIEIQAEVVRGAAATGEGRVEEGLAGLAAAADREDATEKHVVTPGPILPAREVLAVMLLQQHRTGDALREFEAVLAKEPGRLRAALGAAVAAERSGDTDRARRYRLQVQELTGTTDALDGLLGLG